MKRSADICGVRSGVFLLAVLFLLWVVSLHQFRLEQPSADLQAGAATAEHSIERSETDSPGLRDSASLDLQFASLQDAICALDSPYRDSRLAAVYDLSRRAMTACEALPALRHLSTTDSDEEIIAAIKEAIYNIRGAHNAFGDF